MNGGSKWLLSEQSARFDTDRNGVGQTFARVRKDEGISLSWEASHRLVKYLQPKHNQSVTLLALIPDTLVASSLGRR